jgi:hypothetical protein
MQAVRHKRSALCLAKILPAPSTTEGHDMCSAAAREQVGAVAGGSDGQASSRRVAAFSLEEDLACSKAEYQLEATCLQLSETVYTAHTHRHPGVASRNAVGEVTDVRVNKPYR